MTCSVFICKNRFQQTVSLYLSSFQKCLRETVITFTPKNHRACRYKTCDRMHTSSETLCFYYRRDYYTFLKYQRTTISSLNSRHIFKGLFWIKQIGKMKTCRYFSILCQFIRQSHIQIINKNNYKAASLCKQLG